MPDWSGDTHMQMSSRKEASVARVDQVGGSRRETVNKDRFSYEGHWFNGAHIHAGARSFSRRPFHFRRTRPKTVFFWAGVCTPAGPFLLPPFHRTVVASIHATADPLALSTIGFKATGSRLAPPRDLATLRSEGSTIVVQISGSSWLIRLLSLGSRRLKSYI